MDHPVKFFSVLLTLASLRVMELTSYGEIKHRYVEILAERVFLDKQDIGSYSYFENKAAKVDQSTYNLMNFALYRTHITFKLAMVCCTRRFVPL